MITKDQTINELKTLQQETDVEMAHIDADNILCDLLISIGYGDVVDEYEKITKWYS